MKFIVIVCLLFLGTEAFAAGPCIGTMVSAARRRAAKLNSVPLSDSGLLKIVTDHVDISVEYAELLIEVPTNKGSITRSYQVVASYKLAAGKTPYCHIMTVN